jgi:hypothetical protein
LSTAAVRLPDTDPEPDSGDEDYEYARDILPAEIPENAKLQSLHIALPRLGGLPPQISRLRELTSLSITGGYLSAVSHLASLSSLGSLQELRLQDCCADSRLIVPNLGQLSSLDELRLSDRTVILMAEDITSLTNVTSIHIAAKVVERDGLAALPKLTGLRNVTVTNDGYID